MKRISKTTLKIAAATSVTIFSLAATFSASMAGFATLQKQSYDANSLPIRKTESSISGISVHEFYGLTADKSEFGFNPTAHHTITWNSHSGSDTTGFTMGKYSTDDANHPVLFIFALNGGPETIKFATDSIYLAHREPESSVTVATYADLQTYAEGTIIKVESDENHHNVATKYEYTNSTFELKWIELTAENNPLSSAIMTHYFLFADDPTDSTGNCQIKTGNLMVDDGEGNKVSQSKTYLPITSSSFTSANQASFVTFNSNWEPSFTDSISVYDGNTTGYTHLGIVLDYYPDSLEYISSYFLGHPLLNSGLGFVCDWTLVF